MFCGCVSRVNGGVCGVFVHHTLVHPWLDWMVRLGSLQFSSFPPMVPRVYRSIHPHGRDGSVPSPKERWVIGPSAWSFGACLSTTCPRRNPCRTGKERRTYGPPSRKGKDTNHRIEHRTIESNVQIRGKSWSKENERNPRPCYRWPPGVPFHGIGWMEEGSSIHPRGSGR